MTIVLVIVLVELAAGVEDNAVDEANSVTVTTEVLVTIEVAVDTETETEGEEATALGRAARDDETLTLGDGPLLEAFAAPGLTDAGGGWEAGVAATTAPPRNGVGTTVELGLGGGNPPGYESWKISSCAPSKKLYISRYRGGAYVPSNI